MGLECFCFPHSYVQYKFICAIINYVEGYGLYSMLLRLGRKGSRVAILVRTLSFKICIIIKKLYL